MDMEHIMAVLFGPSPPLVGVTVLHHWNTPHTHTHTLLLTQYDGGHVDLKGSPVCLQLKGTLHTLVGKVLTCLGVMCCLCQGDPFTMFIHTVRGVYWSECTVRHAGTHPPHAPVYLPPTTSTLKALCLISTKNFAAAVRLYYSTVTKTRHWMMRNCTVICQWETNDGSHDVTMVLTHDQFNP